MTTVVRKLKQKSGQAAIETGLTLPFLVFLLYYTVNAFHTMHTSHVAQRYAAMNMYERLDNRSMFIVDDVANTLTTKAFIAVQYTNEDGSAPTRHIVLNSGNQNQVLNTVGICREPSCN